MRPLCHGDLIAAARALAAAPPGARGALIARMLVEADLADRYRKRLGRVHPRLGDGSLMAAAMRRPCRAEAFLQDDDYRACMALVLAGIDTWRGRDGGPLERAKLDGA